MYKLTLRLKRAQITKMCFTEMSREHWLLSCDSLRNYYGLIKVATLLLSDRGIRKH